MFSYTPSYDNHPSPQWYQGEHFSPISCFKDPVECLSKKLSLSKKKSNYELLFSHHGQMNSAQRKLPSICVNKRQKR